MSLNVHQLFNKKSAYARQTRTFLFFFIFTLRGEESFISY